MVDKKLIVYPIDINPCFYVTELAEGSGLQDQELTKAVTRMVNRKHPVKLRQKRFGLLDWESLINK